VKFCIVSQYIDGRSSCLIYLGQHCSFFILNDETWLAVKCSQHRCNRLTLSARACVVHARMWLLHRSVIAWCRNQQLSRTAAGQYGSQWKYWARAVNDRHTPWQPVNEAACAAGAPRRAAVTSRCSVYRRDALPEPSLTTTAAHTRRPSTDTPACLATPWSPSNAHAVAWQPATVSLQLYTTLARCVDTSWLVDWSFVAGALGLEPVACAYDRECDCRLHATVSQLLLLVVSPHGKCNNKLL